MLLILQGMDTAGKDGVIKHVVGEMNPGGLQLASFKKPTAEELEHDFLWRIDKQVPAAGRIGVFNRSQYEDVLVVRVHDLVPASGLVRRYAAINAFERELTRQGVTVVKCFLHVSKDVQRERLLARLDDPTKYWKYNAGGRRRAGLLGRLPGRRTPRPCAGAARSVRPGTSSRRTKWYRNWAVAALLEEKLAETGPAVPAGGLRRRGGAPPDHRELKARGRAGPVGRIGDNGRAAVLGGRRPGEGDLRGKSRIAVDPLDPPTAGLGHGAGHHVGGGRHPRRRSVVAVVEDDADGAALAAVARGAI